MNCAGSIREHALYCVGLALVLGGVLGCASTTKPKATSETAATVSGEKPGAPAGPEARTPTARVDVAKAEEEEEEREATRVERSTASGRTAASAKKIQELEGRLQSLESVPSSQAEAPTPPPAPPPMGRF